MRPIFLSYRRDDSEGQAGRLFQDLRTAFGAENVFMDVATIEPGADFRRAIEKNTEACGVLLALIGRNWLSIADKNGQRRLDDPDDFVRIETASALRRDIAVVPVRLQGAPMPRADELPEDMRELAFRNSVELTHARWDSDVRLLIASLRKMAGPKDGDAGIEVQDDDPREREGAARRRHGARGRAWRSWGLPVLAAVVVLAGLGAWLALKDRAGGAASTSPCRAGFVPRAAAAADAVCVTPEARDRTMAENRAAASTREPAGGPYGPNTCRQGFVWREAFAGDVICVVPLSRNLAAEDNRLAGQRGASALR